MTKVEIDGVKLTNVIHVMVSLQRKHSRGEFVGDPPPLHIVIERRCSARAHAQLVPFAAAKKHPKKILLSIKMPNAGGTESIVFDVKQAFVAEWSLENESKRVAVETLRINAYDCTMTAKGGKKPSKYDTGKTILE